MIASRSAALMMPACASIVACAFEPAMSCAYSRLSKPIEAFICSMSGAGPWAK